MADFFPGSRFRSISFRPDAISRVTTTADTPEGLRAANAETGRASTKEVRIVDQLPPVITIVSPRDGETISSDSVSIRVSVRTPADAPATQLRVRVNGRLVELPKGRSLPRSSSLQSGEQTQTLTILLPSDEAEVMVFAENRHGFSTPAIVRLRHPAKQGVPPTVVANAAPSPPIIMPLASTPSPARVPVQSPTKTQASRQSDNQFYPPREVPSQSNPQAGAAPAGGIDLRPTLYVLAVGVSKYRNPAIRLDFAAKDASDFSAALKAQQGGLYRQVIIKLLTDENAKRDDVLDGLEWIRRELTARDVGIVFLAGHGVNDNDGIFYFLPQDVEIDKLKRTGVIFTEIKNTLAALPGKAVFFVDTCHSGNVLGTGRRSLPNDLTAVVNELTSAENGVIVFAASTGRQESQESQEWHNGVFTKALIEGLDGKADALHSGRITYKMLDLYASERVKRLTKGAQSPVTIVPEGVPDFPLALDNSGFTKPIQSN